MARNFYSNSSFIVTVIKQEKLVFVLVILYIRECIFVDLSYSALYGLYFLPGSNCAPFEEVPVSNSGDFSQKVPQKDWRIWGLLGLMCKWVTSRIHFKSVI